MGVRDDSVLTGRTNYDSISGVSPTHLLSVGKLTQLVTVA
jgi:hypothetical protein